MEGGGSTNRMSDSRCSSPPDLLSSPWSLQNPPSTVTFHFAEGESAPSARRRPNYKEKKKTPPKLLFCCTPAPTAGGWTGRQLQSDVM